MSVLGCFGLVYEVLWRMSCAPADPHPLPRCLTRAFVQVPVAIHNIREFAVVFKEVVMGRSDADTLSARTECH